MKEHGDRNLTSPNGNPQEIGSQSVPQRERGYEPLELLLEDRTTPELRRWLWARYRKASE